MQSLCKLTMMSDLMPSPPPPQQALGLVASVESTLKGGLCKSLPMPESQFIRHREIQLPTGEDIGSTYVWFRHEAGEGWGGVGDGGERGGWRCR